MELGIRKLNWWMLFPVVVFVGWVIRIVKCVDAWMMGAAALAPLPCGLLAVV
jgi:uncharacterized membrane protein AbrB (regulator of aidB expression)